jgi:quercetin dioxygenase-like cupin family protein
MASPIILTPEMRPRPLNVVGEGITVLASGAETGGYEVFFQAGPEGTGPPPHSHGWDECFYVVGGEVAFGVGDEALVGKAGTFVHVPAGAVHWFRFGAGGGQMVSMTSREGASQLFAEIDREIAPDAPDLGKLAAIGGPYGVAFAAEAAAAP